LNTGSPATRRRPGIQEHDTKITARRSGSTKMTGFFRSIARRERGVCGGRIRPAFCVLDSGSSASSDGFFAARRGPWFYSTRAPVAPGDGLRNGRNFLFTNAFGKEYHSYSLRHIRRRGGGDSGMYMSSISGLNLSAFECSLIGLT
jgi:hypothetical protein